jgi:DNA-binding beta-propeller fold protein YncE
VNQTVALVHLRTGTVTQSVPTTQPVSHMLAVTADGRRGYTANIVPGTVTELDLAAGGGRPRVFTVAPRVEGIAVTPGGEQVWVGSNEAKTVSVVETGSGAVIETLGGFGMPYRIAITPDGRTAVIADPPQAQVRLVDVATRRETGRITIPAERVGESAEFAGSPSPEGIALSRDGRMAYVALQGSARVAAIDLERKVITGYMDTGRSPDGIGYSPLVR